MSDEEAADADEDGPQGVTGVLADDPGGGEFAGHGDLELLV